VWTTADTSHRSNRQVLNADVADPVLLAQTPVNAEKIWIRDPQEAVRLPFEVYAIINCDAEGISLAIGKPLVGVQDRDERDSRTKPGW
jgi:hypothetical protein